MDAKKSVTENPNVPAPIRDWLKRNWDRVAVGVGGLAGFVGTLTKTPTEEWMNLDWQWPVVVVVLLIGWVYHAVLAVKSGQLPSDVPEVPEKQ